MNLFRLILCCILLVSFTACSGKNAQLEKEHKRAKLQYQIGIDALYKNQLPKAFEALIRSNEIRPNQPEVLDALAFAWRARGNNEQAEHYYKQAIQAGAGAATHTNYGSLLNALTRYSEAEKHLKIALTDPSYNNQYIAFINLGDALAGQQQFDGAIMNYRKAGLLQPRNTLPPLKEAQVYVMSNRWEYARSLYETLSRRYPADRVILQDYLALLSKMRDKNTARKLVANFQGQTTDPLQKSWANEQMKQIANW